MSISPLPEDNPISVILPKYTVSKSGQNFELVKLTSKRISNVTVASARREMVS